MMFLIRWHHQFSKIFGITGRRGKSNGLNHAPPTLIIVVQYSVQKTNPKCNGQNECSSKKIILAPKSSQRKSYIIHNIEANRETMNKSISIQNLNVYFFRVSAARQISAVVYIKSIHFWDSVCRIFVWQIGGTFTTPFNLTTANISWKVCWESTYHFFVSNKDHANTF